MGLWSWMFPPPPRPPPPSKFLDTPWVPNSPFVEEFRRYNLRNKVVSPTMYGGKRKYNLLVLGPVGAGKSSYVNSLLTVTDEDRHLIKDVSECREAARSTTFKLRKFPLCDKIDVFDMPGYDHEASEIEVSMELYLQIMDGKVKDGFDVRRSCEQLDADPERKIDAVIFVFDATKLGSQQSVAKMMPLYKALVQACINREIRHTVVLTKVDKVCDETQKDITKVFHSKIIERVATSVHERLGMRLKNIIPVKNYVDEGVRGPKMDMLLLHSLHTTVRLAEDHARYSQPQ